MQLLIQSMGMHVWIGMHAHDLESHLSTAHLLYSGWSDAS